MIQSDSVTSKELPHLTMKQRRKLARLSTGRVSVRPTVFRRVRIKSIQSQAALKESATGKRLFVKKSRPKEATRTRPGEPSASAMPPPKEVAKSVRPPSPKKAIPEAIVATEPPGPLSDSPLNPNEEKVQPTMPSSESAAMVNPSSTPEGKPKAKDSNTQNDVSRLHEYCARKNLGAPQFEIKDKPQMGRPAPLHQVRVQVNGVYAESSFQPSRKEAKREACYRLLQMLEGRSPVAPAREPSKRTAPVAKPSPKPIEDPTLGLTVSPNLHLVPSCPDPTNSWFTPLLEQLQRSSLRSMLNELIQKLGAPPSLPDTIEVRATSSSPPSYLGYMTAPSIGIQGFYGRWVYSRKDAAKEQVTADVIYHLLKQHGIPRERDPKATDQWNLVLSGLHQIIERWNVLCGYRQQVPAAMPGPGPGPTPDPNLPHGPPAPSAPSPGAAVPLDPRLTPHPPPPTHVAPPAGYQMPPPAIDHEQWRNASPAQIGEMIRALELWQTHIAQGQMGNMYAPPAPTMGYYPPQVYAAHPPPPPGPTGPASHPH